MGDGSGTEDPRLSAVTDLFRGRYAVKASLAWNGLALVFQAEEPGRDVAVAVLPLDLEEGGASSKTFERHAALLEGVDHPTLVPVTDSGVQHGVPYLEFDMVEGPTLHEVLLKEGALAPERAVRFAKQLLSGLAQAHAQGIEHWDLTPSNIVIQSAEDGSENARIVGLGVAPLLEEARDDDMTGPTGRGSGPKASRYLAPEVMLGDRPDFRADLYSVGALLQHMLSGEPPPSKRDEGRTSWMPPGPVSDYIGRLMSREPVGRPRDAAEALAGLGAVEHALLSRPPMAEFIEFGADEDDEQPTRVYPEGLAAFEDYVETADAAAEEATVAIAPPVSAQSDASMASADSGELTAVDVNLMEAMGLLSDSEAPPATAPQTPAEPSASPAADSVDVDTPPTAPVAVPAAVLREPSRDELSEIRRARGPSRIAVMAALVLIVGAAGIVVWRMGEEPAPPAQAASPAPTNPSGPSLMDLLEEKGGAEGALLTGELPEPLAGFHARLEAGEDIERHELTPLYDYAKLNGERDARVHLLLARIFMKRERYESVVERYLSATEANPASRGDPHMLNHLLRIVREEGSVHRAAGDAIRTIYGREALEAVEAAVASESSRTVKRRLKKLRENLDRRT